MDSMGIKPYTLMHQNTRVADIEIDYDTFSITKIKAIHSPEHIPVGVQPTDRAALNNWIKNRSIPDSRISIKDALPKLGVHSTEQLPMKSLCLSFSDQYWIRPGNSDISWGAVNFFANSFSYDIGNILFAENEPTEEDNYFSPDNTSDGQLKKRWRVIENKYCLVKGGNNPFQQEPYNEILATLIMSRLGVPHVPYTLISDTEDYPYSVCENFLTANTELVTAYQITRTQKQANHISLYKHFLNCCETLRIPSAEKSIGMMLVLDYIIANEDRHLGNFGAVRNAETLEYIGIAPIYDSGTSMWCSQSTMMIRPSSVKTPCKPFESTHEKQIKLAQPFDWLDISALKNVSEEWRNIIKHSRFLDKARCDTLCSALDRRIKLLSETIYSQNPSHIRTGPDYGTER
ncbi:MAG: HipA domain-containing protein [Oscillospiraceae bacterium]|jgi:hypothetical protein|nr:HipA domain-containing protein [Oscillospiraceae bacterium]